jgi:polysaccharide export outer membrane protein
MKSQIKISRISKVLTLLILGLLSSCASRQDVVYFQDEAISTALENQNANFELRYKTDDLLTINVSSSQAFDAEGLDVTKPFNLPAVSYNSTVIDAQGNLKMQAYLIDVNGNIEFPVLGQLKLGGLTKGEANDLLKSKLKVYINDPLVTIRLANFTISILGEVKNPGTFTIQDERVSLPEALGMAGDLTIYGRRDNVILIREVNGEKQYAKLDLRSVNIMNSPNYYLTQNDVIYIEPNSAKVRSSSYNQNNGIIISAIGTLATIAAILIK